MVYKHVIKKLKAEVKGVHLLLVLSDNQLYATSKASTRPHQQFAKYV